MNKKQSTIAVFIFFFLGAFTSEAKADIVYLQNGRSIEGIIAKEDNERIVLEIGFGTITFRREEIREIHKTSHQETVTLRKEWRKKKLLQDKRLMQRQKELKELKRKQEFEPKVVEFSQASKHITINAILNKKVDVSLLLDTGASAILLSSRAAERLGIKLRRKDQHAIKVKMADGREVDAKYIVLDSVNVQGAEAKDVEAVVLSEDAQMVAGDGLLGMSFLNRFNFQIDTVNKRLILQKLK